MKIDEIRNLRDAVQFKPFALRLADGRAIPVRHRDFLMTSPSGRTVIVYQPDDSFDCRGRDVDHELAREIVERQVKKKASVMRAIRYIPRAGQRRNLNLGVRGRSPEARLRVFDPTPESKRVRRRAAGLQRQPAETGDRLLTGDRVEYDQVVGAIRALKRAEARAPCRLRFA